MAGGDPHKLLWESLQRHEHPDLSVDQVRSRYSQSPDAFKEGLRKIHHKLYRGRTFDTFVKGYTTKYGGITAKDPVIPPGGWQEGPYAPPPGMPGTPPPPSDGSPQFTPPEDTPTGPIPGRDVDPELDRQLIPTKAELANMLQGTPAGEVLKGEAMQENLDLVSRLYPEMDDEAKQDIANYLETHPGKLIDLRAKADFLDQQRKEQEFAAINRSRGEGPGEWNNRGQFADQAFELSKETPLANMLPEKEKARIAEAAVAERTIGVNNDYEILSNRVAPEERDRFAELMAKKKGIEAVLLAPEKYGFVNEEQVASIQDDLASTEAELANMPEARRLYDTAVEINRLSDRHRAVIKKYPREALRRAQKNLMMTPSGGAISLVPEYTDEQALADLEESKDQYSPAEYNRLKAKYTGDDPSVLFAKNVLNSIRAPKEAVLNTAVSFLETLESAVQGVSGVRADSPAIDAFADYVDTFHSTYKYSLEQDGAWAVAPNVSRMLTDMGILFAGAALMPGGILTKAGRMTNLVQTSNRIAKSLAWADDAMRLTMMGTAQQYGMFLDQYRMADLDEATARNLAFSQAFIQGLLENVSPQRFARGLILDKMANAVKTLRRPLTKREALKLVLKEIGEENIQEVMQTYAEAVVSHIKQPAYGPDIAGEWPGMAEIGEVMLYTTLTTAIFSGLNLGRAMEAHVQEAMEQVAKDPEAFVRHVSKMVDEDMLTVEEGADMAAYARGELTYKDLVDRHNYRKSNYKPQEPEETADEEATGDQPKAKTDDPAKPKDSPVDQPPPPGQRSFPNATLEEVLDGVEPDQQETARATHTQEIQRAISDGTIKRMITNGDITPERAFEIADSVGLGDKLSEVIGPDPRVTEKPPKPTGSRGQYVAEIAPMELDDLDVRPDELQARTDDFSEDTVNSLLAEAKDGSLNLSTIPPILAWMDPETGRPVVLDGHSRKEAFRRLATGEAPLHPKFSPDQFREWNVQFFQGDTFQEAYEAAMTANDRGNVNTPWERGAFARKERGKFDTKKAFDEWGKKVYGRNWPTVDAFSRLNPKGKVIQDIQRAKSDDDVREMERIASWIGGARKANEALTDAHENEIYEFLKQHPTRYTRKDQLITDVNRAYNALEDPSEPLNLKNLSAMTPQEEAVRDEIGKVKADINEKNKEIRDLQGRMTDPNNPGYIDPDAPGYDQKVDRVNELIKAKKDEVAQGQKRVKKLLEEINGLRKQQRAQADLFAEENTPPNEQEDELNRIKDEGLAATPAGEEGALESETPGDDGPGPKGDVRQGSTKDVIKDVEKLAKLLHKDAFAADETFGEEEGMGEPLTDAEENELKQLVGKMGMILEWGDSEGALLRFKDDVSSDEAAETLQGIIDMYAEINGVNYRLEVPSPGVVRMYHGTRKESADAILSEGFEDGGTYFSPTPEKDAGGIDGAAGYGDTVLVVEADAKQVSINGLGELVMENASQAKVSLWTPPGPKGVRQDPAPKQVDVEGLMGGLSKKGEAKLSDYTKASDASLSAVREVEGLPEKDAQIIAGWFDALGDMSAIKNARKNTPSSLFFEVEAQLPKIAANAVAESQNAGELAAAYNAFNRKKDEYIDAAYSLVKVAPGAKAALYPDTGITSKDIPKKLYHATNRDFDKFDDAEKGSNTGMDNTNQGFFFTTKEGLDRLRKDNDGFGDITVEAEVSIKKPLDLRPSHVGHSGQAQDLVEAVTNEEMTTEEAQQVIDENTGLGEWGEFLEEFNRPEVIEALKAKGYDGIVKDMGDGVLEYVAFDSNQIKITNKTKPDGKEEVQKQEQAQEQEEVGPRAKYGDDIVFVEGPADPDGNQYYIRYIEGGKRYKADRGSLKTVPEPTTSNPNKVIFDAGRNKYINPRGKELPIKVGSIVRVDGELYVVSRLGGYDISVDRITPDGPKVAGSFSVDDYTGIHGKSRNERYREINLTDLDLEQALNQVRSSPIGRILDKVRQQPQSQTDRELLNELLTRQANQGMVSDARLDEQIQRLRDKIAREEARTERDQEINDELDDAWDDFRDILGELGQLGIVEDPKKKFELEQKLLGQGMKIVNLYTKKGVYKIADILEGGYRRFGEQFEAFVDSVKQAYLAFGAKATDEVADQMDDRKAVRAINFADIKKKVNDKLDETSDGSSRGEESGTTSGTEGSGQTGGVDRGQGGRGPTEDTGNDEGRTSQGRSGREGDGGSVLSNYVIPEDYTGPDRFSPVETTERNTMALELLNRLEAEGRNATPAEQEVLAQYAGWGGVKEIAFKGAQLNQISGRQRERIETARKLLADFDSLETAESSILFAHFTSPDVSRGMIDILSGLGQFKRILEPSAGTGVFFGVMPESMRKGAKLYGVEKDGATAAILKHLYPGGIMRHSPMEKTNFPNGFFDLVVGNPPFGKIPVYDPDVRDTFRKNLHGYFMAKAIDQVADGGVVAYVTSSFLMDSPGNKPIREYMAANGRLLGAMRLPATAFKNNAGTEVTTDVIFFQKGASNDVSFIGQGSKDGFPINEYFANNPDMIFGDLARNKLYAGEDSPAMVIGPAEGLREKIASKAEKIKERFEKKTRETAQDQKRRVIQNIRGVRPGNMVIENGVIGVATNTPDGMAIDPITPWRSNTKAARQNEIKRIIKDVIPVRDALNDLIAAQVEGSDTAAPRKALKSAYKSFVSRHGKLRKHENLILNDRTDGFNILTLENRDGSLADIFEIDTIEPATIETPETIEDAVVASLSEYGRINPDEISKWLGQPIEEVDTKDLIYEDPIEGWVSKEQYLSGNVRKKLREATEAAKNEPKYARNVEALQAVQPKDLALTPSEIQVPLKSQWVPTKYHEDFFATMGFNGSITYVPTTNQFVVKGSGGPAIEGTNTTVPFRKVIADALHDKYRKVTYTLRTDEGARTYVDEQATDALHMKIMELKNEWEQWIYANPQAAEDLPPIYNQGYNNIVNRSYDGSLLKLPGLFRRLFGIDNFRPYKHQIDAIWMLLQNNGGVVDHKVGYGKSLIMVATAMEMRRMGIAKKPTIVATKSTIEQTAKLFAEAYPASKVLVASEKDFTPANREEFLARIANNDWDAVIMTQEQFVRIPTDPEIESEILTEEKNNLIDAIAIITKDSDGGRSAAGRLQKRLLALEARINKLRDVPADKGRSFTELGIDHVMVDESQAFKNLAYATVQQNIAGLGNPAGSKRSLNMLTNIRTLQKMHGGDKGVTFLSGTPITNSIVEMYSLLRYLRPTKLREMGIHTFDGWASQFAEVETDLELGVVGKVQSKARFRKFINVPELASLYTEIADVRNDTNVEVPLDKPAVKGGKPETVITPLTSGAEKLMRGLLKYAETGDRDYIGLPWVEKDAVMLVASTTAAKAAIDLRLLSPETHRAVGIAEDELDHPDSKLNIAARNIIKTYRESSEFKGVQLVFSDLGTPKTKSARLNLFNYMQVEMGTPTEALMDIFGSDESGNPPKKWPSMGQIDSALIDMGMSEAEIENIKAESLKEGFDVYNGLKDKLVEAGIPAHEIQFIQDYNDAQKPELFRKTNAGEVRILMGGSENLGTGVNVQERVIGMHHLDAPWTPAKYDQRNGRGIRQGNIFAKSHWNNEVIVLNYGMENSLDQMKYDLLAKKAAFLEQLRDGSVTARVYDEKDVGDSLSFAEFAAALTGNNHLIDLVRAQKKLKQVENIARAQDARKLTNDRAIRESAQIIKHIDKQEALAKEIAPKKLTYLPEGSTDPVEYMEYEINGVTYDSREVEMSDISDKIISSFPSSMFDEAVIKVNGTPFKLSMHQSMKGDISHYASMVRDNTTRGQRSDDDILQIVNSNVHLNSQIARTLYNRALRILSEDFEARRKYQREKEARAKAENAEMKDHRDKITALREEVAQLKSEIQASEAATDEAQASYGPGKGAIEKALSVVAQSFPGVDVVIDPARVRSARTMARLGENAAGFVYNGTVYLDPAAAGLDTVVHEFGHVWNTYNKIYNPALYRKGLDLVAGSQYESRVRAMPEYSGLTNEQVLEEALAQAIGEQGSAFLQEAAKNRFVKWLEKMWDRVKEFLGFDVRGMRLAEYAISAAQNIATGNFPITSAELAAAEERARPMYLHERKGVQVAGKMGDLARAKAMAEKGVAMERIEQATGWSQGPAGWQLWHPADVSVAGTVAPGKVLGEVLAAPDVFRMYPDAAGIRLVKTSNPRTPARYNLTDRTIEINPNLIKDVDAQAALVHELQHWIQHEEGVINPDNVQSDLDYLWDMVGGKPEEWADYTTPQLVEAIRQKTFDQVVVDNYHQMTEGDFAPVPVRDASNLMDQYLRWRRQKNKTPLELNGERWHVQYQSQSKSAYFRSRSNSFYFFNDSGTEMIRVSDHWSESQYPRSRKHNCGRIGDCRWTNKEGERFDYRLPGERYASSLIAGRIRLADMKSMKHDPSWDFIAAAIENPDRSAYYEIQARAASARQTMAEQMRQEGVNPADVWHIQSSMAPGSRYVESMGLPPAEPVRVDVKKEYLEEDKADRRAYMESPEFAQLVNAATKAIKIDRANMGVKPGEPKLDGGARSPQYFAEVILGRPADWMTREAFLAAEKALQADAEYWPMTMARTYSEILHESFINKKIGVERMLKDIEKFMASQGQPMNLTETLAEFETFQSASAFKAKAMQDLVLGVEALDGSRSGGVAEQLQQIESDINELGRLMVLMHAPSRNDRVQEIRAKNKAEYLDFLDAKMNEADVLGDYERVRFIQDLRQDVLDNNHDPDALPRKYSDLRKGGLQTNEIADGSGMTTDEAMDKLMEMQRANPEKYRKMVEIADNVRKMLRDSRVQMLYDEGVINDDVYDALMNGTREGFDTVMEHYVPLQVEEEFFGIDLSEGGAPAMIQSLVGTEEFDITKRQNPVNVMLAQYMATVKFIERNKVIRKLGNHIKAANEKAANRGMRSYVKFSQTKPGVVDPNGKLVYGPGVGNISENSLRYFEDGKAKLMVFPEVPAHAVARKAAWGLWFADKLPGSKGRGAKMAEAMRIDRRMETAMHPVVAAFKDKPLPPEIVDSKLFKGFRAITNFQRMILTQANFWFGFRNVFRDAPTALMNLAIYKDMDLRKTWLKQVRYNQFRTFGVLMGATTSIDPKLAAYWKEAVEAGMKMSWADYNKIYADADQMKEIMNDLDKIRDPNYGKRAWNILGNSVGRFNDAMENATRLSVYAALREQGVDVKTAAMIGKNITLNFEKKGNLAPLIEPMYLFFSASMQGVNLSYRALKSKKGKAIFGGVALGAMINRALMYELMDDDDEDKYAYSGYMEEGYLLINFWGGDDPVRFPKPYGAIRVAMSVGENIADAIYGKKSWYESVINMWGQTAAAVDPITGGAENTASSLVPSPVRPFAEVVMNRSWFDSPIHPERYGKLKKSETFKKSTDPGFIWLAQNMERIRLGDAKVGLIDAYPDNLEYVARAYLGGVIKETIDAVMSFEDVRAGYEKAVLGERTSEKGFDMAKMPITKNFYANLSQRDTPYLWAVMDAVFANTGKVPITDTRAKYLSKALVEAYSKGFFTKRQANTYSNTIEEKFGYRMPKF